MKDLEEKTIVKKDIYKGKIIDLELHDVSLPNGNTSKREIIQHPGAVAVIALTNENKLVMVKQYRKALEKSLVEIPAGKMEKGEAPEITAMRELEEETGYSCESMEPITSFYTSPGFANEIVYLYFANRLTRIHENQALDEDEFVELLEVTIEEAEEMMKNKQIHDAKTAYALQYIKLQRLNQK
ncbi:NUDIX hydrolase [Bacillus carboniphilus]|uniref:NUDIX hydrolase n=1 Tax=Bacillus carboniphilus TaxID=86663 RepID=A0ABY9JWP1_9BACI|nr:NUDIX hydrolase [Bacillus carboniphilus]WLR43812.1 NUDIX hydrolase [Bacillus carboniphilus]